MIGDQLELFTKIIDETESEVIPFRYEITSYGADYPVDSLVKRLRRKTIFVPPFQRQYVWNKQEASKFIESLLLGLPVPGIFLSKEKEEKKLLIVDGQQRLLTLLYFYEQVFKDNTAFKLEGVQEDLNGKSYNDLSLSDRNRLDDSIIHSTIIKQDEPDDDNDSSIYQIFERINSGGRPLSPQEIRACIYYGEYNKLLVDLATKNTDWRTVIGGAHNDRLKEEELILRYFSLLLNLKSYKKPMKEFLNNSMSNNRNFKNESEEVLRGHFEPTIAFINKALGNKAFRLQRGVHSALFDSIMVATTKRLSKGKIESIDDFIERYENLLTNSDFKRTYTSATSDEKSVLQRVDIAINHLMKAK